jgi:serine/threonine protein phosphatase PrpC
LDIYFSNVELYKSDYNTNKIKINLSIKNKFLDFINSINIENYSKEDFKCKSEFNYSNNIDIKIDSIKSSKIDNDLKSENLNLNYELFSQKLLENNYSIIKNSFLLAEESLIYGKFEMKFSGSTSICIFILDNKIICANVGDSRAILITRNKSRISKNNILSLSNDHKPDIKEEALRIIKNNGRIDKITEYGLRTGPSRVWCKNVNYPGLAITRSIGDLVATTIGVISDPEIIEFELNEDSKYIILASDGIWEVLTNEEVRDIVDFFYNEMDCESAVNKLIDEAKKKWEMVNFF